MKKKLSLIPLILLLFGVINTSYAANIFIFNPEGWARLGPAAKSSLEAYLSDQGISAKVYIFAKPDDFEAAVKSFKPDYAIVSSYFYYAMAERYGWRSILSAYYDDYAGYSKILVTQKSIKTPADLKGQSIATVSLGAQTVGFVNRQFLNPINLSSNAVKLMLVSKDFDAVMAAGFNQVQGAVVTVNSFNILKKVYPNAVNNLKILKTLPVILFPKVVAFPGAGNIEKVTAAFQKMNEAARNNQLFGFLGVNKFMTPLDIAQKKEEKTKAEDDKKHIPPDQIKNIKFLFVKSATLNQFDDVIDGFKESFQGPSVLIHDMKGEGDKAALDSVIKKEKPNAIICLGALAATSVAELDAKVPVLFSMVINYKRYDNLKSKNFTGVAMEISPAVLLAQFRLLFKDINSVGVPFHPEVSSEIIDDTKKAAGPMNIKIFPIPVNNPDELLDKLNSGKNNFNGLMMIGDFKLYNKDTSAFQDLMKFSSKSKIPLLAVSEPFVKAGAFFSVSINLKSLGSQLAVLGRMCTVDNVNPAKIPVAKPIGSFTVMNRDSAMSILGDKFDKASLNLVDKVYPEEE